MKKIFALFLMFLSISAFADDGANNNTPPRISLFSTTVDWEAVTGLSLRQYSGKFHGTNRNLIKDGLVLYYLDAFPCYGEADSVRIWISSSGKMSGHLRLVCVAKPETISFAWRNATEDAVQARSTGILTCPVDGKYNFTIDISKCVRGPDWTEYK